MKRIEMSKEDELLLKDYIENLDQLIESDDVQELLIAIDDAIVGELDEDYNSTKQSQRLQDIYDMVLDNYSRNFCKK